MIEDAIVHAFTAIVDQAAPIIGGAVSAIIGARVNARAERLKRLAEFRHRISKLIDPIEWECLPHNQRIDTNWKAVWELWQSDMKSRIAEIKPDISAARIEAFEKAQKDYYTFDARNTQSKVWTDSTWRKGIDPHTPEGADSIARSVRQEMVAILSRLQNAATQPTWWEEIRWINGADWK